MIVFTLIFSDEETGRVKTTVTDVRTVHRITTREVGITDFNGLRRNIAFPENEKLEVLHRRIEMH